MLLIELIYHVLVSGKHVLQKVVMDKLRKLNIDRTRFGKTWSLDRDPSKLTKTFKGSVLSIVGVVTLDGPLVIKDYHIMVATSHKFIRFNIKAMPRIDLES